MHPSPSQNHCTAHQKTTAKDISEDSSLLILKRSKTVWKMTASPITIGRIWGEGENHSSFGTQASNLLMRIEIGSSLMSKCCFTQQHPAPGSTNSTGTIHWETRGVGVTKLLFCTGNSCLWFCTSCKNSGASMRHPQWPLESQISLIFPCLGQNLNLSQMLQS